MQCTIQTAGVSGGDGKRRLAWPGGRGHVTTVPGGGGVSVCQGRRRGDGVA